MDKLWLSAFVRARFDMADVVSAVNSGEIIKDYLDDTPHPSSLILGLDQKNEKIHVVMGMNQESLWFITAYRPDSEQWSDDLKRGGVNT